MNAMDTTRKAVVFRDAEKLIRYARHDSREISEISLGS